MAMKEDQTVWPTMLELKDCLCEEIESAELPSVCFCDVMPGGTVPYDYADQGMAWVRLTTGYPSLTFPTQTDSLRSCAVPLAFQLEVGIVRCPTFMKDTRRPPTATEEREAVRVQLADMAAMRRAIQCCLGKKDAVLGAYTPTGPDDGAIGGRWLVTVG